LIPIYLSLIFDILAIVISRSIAFFWILSLFDYFPQKYNVEIIPSHEMDSILPETSVKAVMEIIYKKASFGDALVARVSLMVL